MAMQDSLKKAIVQMVPKEKDKLLLRLINKDKALVDKLYFELIEESSTLTERREAIHTHIEHVSHHAQNTAGWILMDMRSLSGEITYHVKITKDKIGGVELNLFLMNTFFERYENQLKIYTNRSDKFALYAAKKANTILHALYKLAEDYQFDFKNDVNKMLEYIHTLCTRIYVQQLGLPRKIE